MHNAFFMILVAGDYFFVSQQPDRQGCNRSFVLTGLICNLIFFVDLMCAIVNNEEGIKSMLGVVLA